jgi:hypothetical protein
MFHNRGSSLAGFALVLVLIAVVIVAVYIVAEPYVGDLLTQLKDLVP